MRNKYGEPWTFDKETGKIKSKAQFFYSEYNRNRANRRSIACVNACAGIPTRELRKLRAAYDAQVKP